ncbi:MAG: neutral/alkaline non-lysosomal ceramidase N-terminal domain-containing protein [Candidatus Omnitrophica bacterium]|nr:neutral/alkaline non-lysosomal ceramidase N-terminal domain-containing protein [Candidatus Omnitrophota bacterium]
MKGRQALLIAGCWLLIAICAPPAFSGEILVGASRVELTLPPNVPLAGYSKRHGRPSTGQRDPLYVRALVLQSETQSVVFVSAELLIIDDALRQEVERRLPSPPNLFLVATHTHSGPGAYGRRYLEKLSMGHYDARVFEAIAETIVRAVRDARQQLLPLAEWQFGVMERSGANRNRLREGGPVDPEVLSVLFSSSRGPVAMLITFAAHPTVLGWKNRELSGDYPGYLMRACEQEAHAVCLFFPGAIADQGPVTEELPDRFERARRLGEQLAEAAMNTRWLTHRLAQPEHRGRFLDICTEHVALPPAQMRVGQWQLPRWLGETFLDRTATITVVAVDSLRFIGVPGDLSSELGRQWKGWFWTQGYAPVLAGFANDYIGYILPAAQYEADEYEAQMMFNGPTVADTLWSAIQRCHATIR